MTANVTSANVDEDLACAIIGVERSAAKGDVGRRTLVSYLGHESERVSDLASLRIRESLPMAALTERWSDARTAVDIPESLPGWIRDSCAGWGAEGDLADDCVDAVASAPEAVRSRTIERLARIPGLRRTLTNRFTARGHLAFAREFARRAVRAYYSEYPLQVGVYPTLACQLRCPFCVSAGLGGDKAPTMSWAAMVKFLDWAACAGVRRLCITGGEPTLYPQFPEFLEQCRTRNLEVLLATHGLCGEKEIDAIVRTNVPSVTLHFAPEVRSDENRMAQYGHTATRLIQAGIYTAMRCNIESKDENVGVFVEVARRLGIREIRTAVPMPNSGRRNRFVQADGLAKFGAKIGELVDAAGRCGIDVKLAKPFPLCLLPEAAARLFILNGSMLSNCSVADRNYTLNMLVFPDLKYAACLALNASSQRPITDFRGPEAASAVYRANVARIQKQPFMPACATCPLALGGRCVGACLAYRQTGQESHQ